MENGEQFRAIEAALKALRGIDGHPAFSDEVLTLTSDLVLALRAESDRVSAAIDAEEAERYPEADTSEQTARWERMVA